MDGTVLSVFRFADPCSDRSAPHDQRKRLVAVERCAQLPCRLGRVGGLKDGSCDGDAARPAGDQRGCLGSGDPALGEHPSGAPRGRRERVRAQRRSIGRLREGRVDGGEVDVVDTRAGCGGDLLDAVGRAPDQGAGPEAPARVCGGDGVEAEVRAVDPEGLGDVEPSVDDDADAPRGAAAPVDRRRTQGACPVQPRRAVEPSLPKLDPVDPMRARGADGLGERGSPQRAVDDQAEGR